MIRADNITVEFGNRRFGKRITALDRFSLAVNEGDIYALLGPNGAGKSTAMYCFLGLIQPDKGSVAVNGFRPFPGAPQFSEIAYLPEEPHYHRYLTVLEAVNYYARLYGNIPVKAVDDAIERVGLASSRSLQIAKCSKGMKQKVGIAQCILQRPKLMFLDEPTRGLDPVTVRDFREIILDMNRAGTTVVVNSHVLSEIETVCNRVAIIDKGTVIREGDIDSLRGSDREVYLVEFEGLADPPEYVTALRRTGDSIRGEIPADHLGAFVMLVEAAGGKIIECSFKRLSLEDAFFSAINGEALNV